ncbi:MAG: hypothetical protein SGJ11_02585 [Phycisphaerae bacterium]|nr:hypothetical protein [Phycisphaerae bacterium]
MKRRNGRIGSAVTAAVTVWGMTLAMTGVVMVPLTAASAHPLAASELTLKNGKTWRGEINDTVEAVFIEGGRERKIEGKIVRADKTMVVIEVEANGSTSRKSIFFGDLRSLKTTAAAAVPTDSGADAPTADPNGGSGEAVGAVATNEGGEKAVPSNFKGVFILPMEGMVGTGLRHEQIEEIGKAADKFGPGQIIVLQIDSGGGLVRESVEISRVMIDIKKRHRVVAWIKEAISAAAFTALHCDEIYFMNVGALGSITMFAGTVAIKGDVLDAWVAEVGKVARIGGRSEKVIRCMIHAPFECSYTIPPGGGPKDAIFFDDLSGEVALDDKSSMLTLNATRAYECGFSDGTADNEEQLGRLLGIPEWKEVDDSGRKIYRDWQRLLKDGSEDIVKLVAQFNFKGAGGGDKLFLQSRIRILTDLIRWYDKCEPCIFEAAQKGAGLPPKQVLQDELERLKEDLSRMNRQRR